MAKYIINGESMTNIADAIREKNGTSDTMTPEAMVAYIQAFEGTAGGSCNCPEDLVTIQRSDTFSDSLFNYLDSNGDVSEEILIEAYPIQATSNGEIMGYMRVSEKVLTASDFANGFVLGVTNANNGVYQEEVISPEAIMSETAGDNIVMHGFDSLLFIACDTDNATIEDPEGAIIFPKAGTYIPAYLLASGLDVSITIPGSEWIIDSIQISEKYMQKYKTIETVYSSGTSDVYLYKSTDYTEENRYSCAELSEIAERRAIQVRMPDGGNEVYLVVFSHAIIDGVFMCFVLLPGSSYSMVTFYSSEYA